MKEKLVIRNFGPIKSVELELSRFNVFIGEQGTGKSTVAKVLAVCRYFSYINWGKITYSGKVNTPFSIGLEDWGLEECLMPDSFIYYECLHYNLTAEYYPVTLNNDGNVSEQKGFSAFPVLRSKECKALIDEFRNIRDFSDDYNNEDAINSVPYSFFQRKVSKVFDNPFYLPTERGLQSIFSLGKESFNNMSDSLFRYFAETDKIVRNFKNETEIIPLNLIYKNVDGRSYIKKKGSESFSHLDTAASGYQSTIPVVLLMEYYISIRKKAKTFIIEEPELNLFPSAQKELMHYLVDKTMNYGNMMLLTTHSPYVLTTLNNLIYAYQTGQINKEKVNEIIEEKYWLNPDEVSVYQFLSNGYCENIVADDRLIKADKIDVVSRKINESFDALLDIELSTEKETL